MTMGVLQTLRLSLRHFNRADAPFIFELLNEPSWLQCVFHSCRPGVSPDGGPAFQGMPGHIE
jgi:hypothetical protein